MEAVQVCFSAEKVLKFSFHKSKSRVMLVDVCLISVKMRSRCSHFRASPVEPVQSSFNAMKLHKFNFHNYRGHAIHVDGYLSAGEGQVKPF